MVKVLRIENLTAGYGGEPIIKDISFELYPGEILHVVGPNGAGKSTLLRTIARIIRDNTGHISFGGVDLQHRHTHELRSLGISWFVQGGMVLPSLTVREHLELVLRGMDRPTQVRLKDECLTQFPTLQQLMPKRGGNLSGGQRQTLSLAMLMAQQTDCWLMDEPMAGLAPEAVDVFAAFLKEASASQKSILLVDHGLKLSDLDCTTTMSLRSSQPTN